MKADADSSVYTSVFDPLYVEPLENTSSTTFPSSGALARQRKLSHANHSVAKTRIPVSDAPSFIPGEGSSSPLRITADYMLPAER